MGVTAAIIGAVAAVGSATNSVVQGQKQAKANAKAAQQQETLLTQQQDAIKAQEAQDAAEAARASQADVLQRQRAAAASGRSDTILTGPLGTTGSTAVAGTGAKTLLGS